MEIIELDLTSSEKDDAGELVCNAGDAVTGIGWVQAAPLWCTEGFYGLPNEPDGEGASRALVLRDGQQSYVVAIKENRIVAKYGEMKPGDRSIITRSGAAVFLKEEGKSVTLSFNPPDGGPTLVAQLDGESKSWKVVVGDGTDSSWHTQSPSKIYMGVSGGGAIKIDKNGVTINGNKCAVNCGNVSLGVMPGGSAPVPPTNGVAYTVAGPVNLISTSVVVAP